MSDPSPVPPNASFSQGVNANSPAQFNLSFQPPIPNNVNYNSNNNTNPNGSGGMAMPPGVNPQMFFQNSNGNGIGNGFIQQQGMNGQPQGQGPAIPHSASPVNGSQFDPAALQARIALAQQMAQQGMQQHNQQEQKANGTGGQQGSLQDRRASGSGSGSVPAGDWAQLANAANTANAGAGGGAMPNAQATTREALMKQASLSSNLEW